MAPAESEKMNKMCRLTDEQLQIKLDFIKQYINASNASEGSTFDPNSNVASKNIATMMAEINKDINIQIKRALVTEKMRKLWGSEIANLYITQLEKHIQYCHDETGLMPYCVAISMYPFLQDGLKAFGGETKAPKHLSSFNGGFINLIFAISSQFCGAVATVEYLMCFDYFARKEYGDNYLEEHTHTIEQELQQVVYALNQPASARGFQSVFWNISIFDKNYFDSLFGNFYFPDGERPKWETLNKLQKFFMKWFNKERTEAMLTFPVVTVSLLDDGESIVDKEYKKLVAKELSEGNSFFVYTSDTVDSLSSCCFKGDEVITVVTNEGEKKYTIQAYVEKFSNGAYIDSPVNTDDSIISYCPDTDDFEEVRITGVLKKKYTGKMISVKVGKIFLHVTTDHLFIVKNKYTEQLEELDALTLCKDYLNYKIMLLIDGTPMYRDINLMHESVSEQNCDVYDIQLEKNHYFFANGVLTHNCRLRNSIADQINDFSYSLGAGGVMTGSMNVLTLNMNRFIQNVHREYESFVSEYENFPQDFKSFLGSALASQIKLMHKYQIGFKLLFQEFLAAHMLPVYEAHYIELDKQYLTIGVNGLMEGIEFLGVEASNNPEYKEWVSYILKIISQTNKESAIEFAQYKVKFNTEMVPAENLGVKFAKWDKKDGYVVPRDCYNSYFYPVESDITILDKIVLHGKQATTNLDGGSALHLNLEEYPSAETAEKLLDAIVQEGCPYFCTNVKITICNDCGHIDKNTRYFCPKCHSTNIDYATRVIGYLRRITNFSKERQIEESKRRYHKC